jgi:hypothetical protein
MVGKLIKFKVFTYPEGIRKPSKVTEHDGEIQGIVKISDGNLANGSVAIDAFLVKENSTGFCFVVTPYNIISFR